MSVYITRKMIRRSDDWRKNDEPRSLFGRLARSLADRWERSKAITDLSAMSDRELRDIGIYRGDISRMVDGVTLPEMATVRSASRPEPNGRWARGTQPDMRSAASI